MESSAPFSLACPIPITEYPHVLMAHGGGGRLMQQLIGRIFQTAFAPLGLQADRDSALLPPVEGRLAFTTDSFVVSPYRFPGGDIGSLAVHGTVNDLAMSGARPLALSAGFILEEGLPIETLWEIALSMRRAAEAAGVRLVTGDTKVVERGRADGLYINTAGIGVVAHDLDIGPAAIQPGDRILINGDLGRHGMAIMAVREGLAFETEIESDSAPLAGLVGAMLEAGVPVHALRDLTRGGLASALNELAAASGQGFLIDERTIPVRDDVRGACEMLGFDPLYVANEGRLVAFVPPEHEARALAALRAHPEGAGACCIGTVAGRHPGIVEMISAIGARRILDLLTGEQLPRIC